MDATSTTLAKQQAQLSSPGLSKQRRRPALPLLEAVSSEVVRKLRLASEAESKEDREIVLEEIFCDVTGLLDDTAQAQLGLDGPLPFYAVLAHHYATPWGADTAVAVLHLLQGLYSQGYAAPLVALLLHRWLLVRRSPGRGLPEEQRVRLANVLCLGAAQLFLGDVAGGATAFEPLWHCLCYEVILGQEPLELGIVAGDVRGTQDGVERSSGSVAGPGGGMKPITPPTLAGLPSSARTGLLAAVGAFLVYYVAGKELEELLKWFPPPTATPAPSVSHNAAPSQAHNSHHNQPGSGSPQTSGQQPHQLEISGRQCRPPLTCVPWEGVDFIVLQIVDMLTHIRSEAGLVHYLAAVQQLSGQPALHGPHGMRLATQLRLQGVLYSLSSPGGPHYAPKAVRTAALASLDKLFPAGRTTRHLIRMLFRLLHPTDWIWDLASVPLQFLKAGIGRLVLAAFYTLYSLVVWRRWGGEGHEVETATSSRSQAGAIWRPRSQPRSDWQQPQHEGTARVAQPATEEGSMGSDATQSLQDATAGKTIANGVHTSVSQSTPAETSLTASPAGTTTGQDQSSTDEVTPVRTRKASGTQQDQVPVSPLTGLPSRRIVPESVEADAVKSLVRSSRELAALGSGSSSQRNSSESAATGSSPGSWGAAGQQFLAGACSAVVGSSMTAVESGVKAVGEFASRLTNSAASKIASPAAGSSPAGNAEAQEGPKEAPVDGLQ